MTDPHDPTPPVVPAGLPLRQPGLNLHVYPSDMLRESRIYRISAVLQESGLFSATHLVGIVGDQTPGESPFGSGRVIVRLGDPSNAGKSLLGTVRSRAGWFGDVIRHYQDQPVSVVNAHSVWSLPSCAELARRTGAALVYSTHELETETPTMTGAKKRAAQAIERALIRRCDLVSVVNAPIADWYAETYDIDRPLVARNIPVQADSGSAPLRADLGLDPHEVLLIHTGRIDNGRHVPEILDIVRSGPGHIHLAFLGDGPLRPLVEQAAARCPRIHWIEPVDHSRVVAHVRAADVSLCLIDTTALSYRLSTPNKLFEALAAPTPVLCTDLPGAAELIGADLWPKWHVDSVPSDLARFLATLTSDAIEDFRSSFPGLPTWQSEAAPLVAAYADMLDRVSPVMPR